MGTMDFVLELVLKNMVSMGYTGYLDRMRSLHLEKRNENGKKLNFHLNNKDGSIKITNFSDPLTVGEKRKFDNDLLKAFTKADANTSYHNIFSEQEDYDVKAFIKFPLEAPFLYLFSSENNFKELDTLFGGYCPSVAVVDCENGKVLDLNEKKHLFYFMGQPIGSLCPHEFKVFASLEEAEKYDAQYGENASETYITDDVDKVNSYVKEYNEDLGNIGYDYKHSLYTGTVKDLLEDNKDKFVTILYDGANNYKLHNIDLDNINIRGPVVFLNAELSEENLPLSLFSIDKNDQSKICLFCIKYAFRGKNYSEEIDKFVKLCNDHLVKSSDGIISISPASGKDIFQNIGGIDKGVSPTFFCEYGGANKDVSSNEKILLKINCDLVENKILLNLYGPAVDSATKEVLCISAVRAFAETWDLPINRDTAVLNFEKNLPWPNRSAYDKPISDILEKSAQSLKGFQL